MDECKVAGNNPNRQSKNSAKIQGLPPRKRHYSPIIVRQGKDTNYLSGQILKSGFSGLKKVSRFITLKWTIFGKNKFGTRVVLKTVQRSAFE